ncbi:MAG TPA: AlkA N-terminal domain-containing protein [Acidimicrobiales bacterium]|nr:AlkA N-terminal domain-containing protein [Acidimicrobiales bacterium]
MTSRDGRFDGAFVTAVLTTKIYCRPSCPAMTPKRRNMRFYATPAAAQEAGFRACKRCRPDAAPGSPDWDIRADLVARAVRLIGDGVVEREGVAGLAQRLGYSSRQLHRLVFAELGTGPLRLALAHRVQSARALLETTDLPVSDVAWAAGFGSIRQFNDRIREVYALSPSELRKRARKDGTGANGASGADGAGGAVASGRAAEVGGSAGAGVIPVRLAYRPPLDLPALLAYLGRRAIPGVESFDGEVYTRTLALPHGTGVMSVRTDGSHNPSGGIHRYNRPGTLKCDLRLDDVRDFSTAVSRVRRLLDLDADPLAVHSALREDRVLGHSVEANPGLRVPGGVDGAEIAVRAVLGQQISVAGARTLAGRLAWSLGAPLPHPRGSLVRVFPSAEVIAGVDPSDLSMPASRARALVSVTAAIAAGDIVIDPGADRDGTERSLRALPGIGPWTASYVRMRGLGDPDVFLGLDLGVKKAIRSAGEPIDSDLWKPWRSYANFHLWTAFAGASQPAT